VAAEAAPALKAATRDAESGAVAGRPVTESRILGARQHALQSMAMFTGIVEEVGRVQDAARQGEVLRVRIAAPRTAAGLPIGGSVAVSGCCLTAVEVGPESFDCELTAETLARTAFEARLVPGRLVNLERPLRADGRFDGHVVQGHVDGVGRVRALRQDGRAAELDVECPNGLERYLVEKGSVTVDGISLTVARLLPAAFAVAIIPYTLENTNLRETRAGAPVNIEADVIAKYVERLLAFRGPAGSGLARDGAGA
jgi:riboflavin synthase